MPLPGGRGCRLQSTTESLSFKAEGDFLAIIQKNYILLSDLITSLNFTSPYTLVTSAEIHLISWQSKELEEQAAGGRQAESQPWESSRCMQIFQRNREQLGWTTHSKAVNNLGWVAWTQRWQNLHLLYAFEATHSFPKKKGKKLLPNESRPKLTAPSPPRGASPGSLLSTMGWLPAHLALWEKVHWENITWHFPQVRS